MIRILLLVLIVFICDSYNPVRLSRRAALSGCVVVLPATLRPAPVFAGEPQKVTHYVRLGVKTQFSSEQGAISSSTAYCILGLYGELCPNSVGEVSSKDREATSNTNVFE